MLQWLLMAIPTFSSMLETGSFLAAEGSLLSWSSRVSQTTSCAPTSANEAALPQPEPQVVSSGWGEFRQNWASQMTYWSWKEAVCQDVLQCVVTSSAGGDGLAGQGLWGAGFYRLCPPLHFLALRLTEASRKSLYKSSHPLQSPLVVIGPFLSSCFLPGGLLGKTPWQVL